MALDLAATLAALPPPHRSAAEYRSQVRSLLETDAASVPLLVALDDDPTGTQTCHNVAVLTVWDVPTLTEEFRRHAPAAAGPRSGGDADAAPGFFILTNSRALHPAPARALIQAVCRNLQAASAATGRAFDVVLRGDSTLRGHFPLEPEAVESVLGAADAWVLCPFFLQGGRYTLGNVHYVAEAGVLVPAAATPFARDATFGYRSSDLRDYVVEKGRGAIAAESVTAISLDTIRRGGPAAIRRQLRALPPPRDGQRSIVVVNAAAEEDVDAVVLALLQAGDGGGGGGPGQHARKRFLFRTGAAFVSSRLGMAPIPPVTAAQLEAARPDSQRPASRAGGLIIAGSYVPKTTAQLEALTARTSPELLTTVVIGVDGLLAAAPPREADAATPPAPAVPAAVRHAIDVAEQALAAGRDVLVMTSRRLVVGADAAASLDIGAAVARALVAFLAGLQTRPRYVVAKGGITSSDMATQGLRIRRALVVGQAAPGVPLWRCDEPTCKWPGLPYVVFPGNVGSNETLYDVVEGWRPKRGGTV